MEPAKQTTVRLFSKLYKPKVPFKMFDIAANLSDPRFKGVYHGKQAHENDFEVVIERAREWGVQKFLFAAGHIEDAEDSYELSKGHDNFYSTIGIHPCRSKEPFSKLSQDASKDEQDKALANYIERIEKFIESADHKAKIVAIGECGLDYDRFEYADKDTQMKVFPPHFDLAQKYSLPMYLHSRATNGDFSKIVQENRHKFSTGVVHSFTGDETELKELLAMDLFIGINGCSMKTEENLKIIQMIPMDKVMIETDCPYCDIRKTHASHKYVETDFQKVDKKKYKSDKLIKDRNEPCTMIQVLEVYSKVIGKSKEEVAQHCWENTCRMFKLDP